MAVFRVEKTQNYTVMSNHHLRNVSLSLKAKGLLSQMLSLPDVWDYTLAGLSRINREKIDAIREAVRELEAAGYITRSRVCDEKGRLQGADYIIHELPQSGGDHKSLANTTFPPTLDFPTLDNPTQLNKECKAIKDKSITDLSNTDSIPFTSPRVREENPERNGTEAKRASAFEIYRDIIRENLEYDINTEHYKGDFKYDIEMFKEAARNPDGDNNRLLWFSRHSGTHCLQEREVYIKDTSTFNTWNAYGKLLGSPDFYHPVVVEDRILAYAVNITGVEKGRIKGDLYELDYRDHIRQLDKLALPLHTVTATYKDGATFTMPHKEHDAKHMSFYHQHGQLQTLVHYPEDAGALRDILQQVRDKRESEARPAFFKVRVQNPEPRIKQQLAAGKKQLAADRAAAPQRAAAKTKNNALEV